MSWIACEGSRFGDILFISSSANSFWQTRNMKFFLKLIHFTTNFNKDLNTRNFSHKFLGQSELTGFLSVTCSMSFEALKHLTYFSLSLGFIDSYFFLMALTACTGPPSELFIISHISMFKSQFSITKSSLVASSI